MTNRNNYYAILVIALLCVIAYYPGLSDFFISDDIPNITSNPALQVTTLDSENLLIAATSNESGPLKRPISSLSFGLNYYFSGQQFDPSDFKLTNLIIHIINAFLIYLLATSLLKILNKHSKQKLPVYSLVLVIAAAWALHPAQLTAVLYVVQRMTSLSAMFVLAGLLLFVSGRVRLSENRLYGQLQMYAGIGLGTILGALCKENALLLPYLAVVIELTILSRLGTPAQANKKPLQLFYTITAIIPAVLALAYLYKHPELILNGYAIRDFTMTERLMTETRILFNYIAQILYPALHNFTLYHDNIKISHTVWQPLSTVASIFGVVGLITASLIFRKKHPVLAFAILWFFTAHAMESNVFPLVLMYEHRNYLPSLGIIFAAVYYGYVLLHTTNSRRSIKIGASLAILLCLTALTHVRSEIWSSEATLSYFNVKNNSDSAQAHASRAVHLLNIQGDTQKIYNHLRSTAQLSKSDVGSLMTMLQILESAQYQNNLAPSPPTHYFGDLLLNQQYIQRLRKFIVEEINNRLKNSKLFVPAVAALRGSTDCAVKDHAPHCLALLNETFHWLNIALDNPSLLRAQRPVLWIAHARINAYNGDLEAALEDLNVAYNEQPEEIYILIEKLTLLITLQEWGKAKLIIHMIENHPSFMPHHKRALKQAKWLYEEEYSNRTTTSPESSQNKNVLPH